MSWRKTKAGESPNAMSSSIESDATLGEILKNFRQSAQAWSEAEYNRPRRVEPVTVHGTWRMAAVWALGCVLAAGSLSGGLYEHHHLQQVARQQTEARAARERQLAAQERTRKADENLLANVDTDVSRSVPAALEPLAQLMEGDEGQ